MMDYLVFHRMGKVGSHSILHSLRASAPGLRVDQAHFLTPEAIARVRQLAEAPATSPETAASLRGQVEDARRCVEEIERRRRRGNPYCVLSGYRDPLDQVVATLFQMLPLWFPEVDEAADDVAGQAAIMVRKFQTQFRKLIVDKAPASTAEDVRFANVFVKGLNWFDREFRPFHDVDLYEHEPDELGMFRVERGPVLVLVYRMESLRGHFDEVLGRLPGVKSVQQINDNEAAKKKCAALYREFRRRLEPTPEMHDFYYNSRFFRHFYRGEAPHFARPGEPALRIGAEVLHDAAARVSELESVRRELREAQELIGRIQATKIWRLRTLMRRVLLRSRES